MEIQRPKFKVVQKVIATDEQVKKYALNHIFDFESPNFIAYKITAGLYIFYITDAVYKQGVAANIIEPITENVNEIEYSDMRRSRGLIVNHRMPYALRLSTLKYLQASLKEIRNGPRVVTVKVFQAEWYEGSIRLKTPKLIYLEEIKVDLLNRIVLYNNSRHSATQNWPFPIFLNIATYDAFLDRLVYELDREFMNSKNIFSKFNDVDFFEVDYWLQRLYKFEFISE